MYKLVAIFVLISVCYVRSEPKAKQTVQIAPEKASSITRVALQCISETDADPALLIQIRNRKYSDDENVKKFFTCVFRKTGFSSKKGVIRVDRMLEIYPEKADKEALRKVMGECNKEETQDPQDKIYNFFKCFQEKTPVRITL